MLYHIVSGLCILLPPCANDVMLSDFIMYVPCLPCLCQGYLSIVINWTTITGLIPCQVQPGPAHVPLSPPWQAKVTGRAPRPGCLRSLFLRSIYMMYAASASFPYSKLPAHLYQLDTYYWTYTI